MKKLFIGLILGIMLCCVGVYAADTIFAKNVLYKNSKNTNIKDVEGALNDLYSKVGTLSGDKSLFVNSWNYSYIGKPQTFIVPIDGVYKLEVWGAQGGSNAYTASPGGKGGYSIGYYKAKKGDKLYIYVGGQGTSYNGNINGVAGGWNGGGGAIEGYSEPRHYCQYNGTGGGATDISLVSSDVTYNSSTLRYERSEKSYDGRIIVAGGGGGGGDLYNLSTGGGCGGGTTGASFGGTQNGITDPIGTGILAKASKGLGGSARGVKGASCTVGGGAGYYGGSHSQSWKNVANTKPSGGGSGYIGGVLDYGDDKATTISGTNEMPTYDGKEKMTGNSGNGYAKITFIAIK